MEYSDALQVGVDSGQKGGDAVNLPMWEVLFGVDRGAWFSLSSSALLIYVLLRVWMTFGVAKLRGREAQTDVTPDLADYQSFLSAHFRLLPFLFSIVVILILIQMLPGLSSQVPSGAK